MMRIRGVLLVLGLLALSACAPTPSPSVSAPPPTPSPSPSPVRTFAPAAVALAINGGDPSFADPDLKLSISVTPGSESSDAMRFAENDGAWSPWELYRADRTWLLTKGAGYGTYTIDTQVRDASGHIASAQAIAEYVSSDTASMDVTSHYSFKASLDYRLATIEATETIRITNTSGALLSTLNLATPPRAFGEFKLGTVKVDGVPAKNRWTNNDNLRVTLGRNMRADESFDLVITFVATATKDISTSLAARLSKVGGIMQVSQWFPIISDGHALRYPGDSQFTATAEGFRLELSIDPKLIVAAPGKIISTSKTERVFELGPARDFAFAISPAYQRQVAQVDGVEIQVYSLAGTAGAAALQTAQASLRQFIDTFGPYPYETFVIAQATRPGAGNEYPGIVFIGKLNLGSAIVVRHETSHQWFYTLLGNDQLREPWLDEAFAEWAGRDFGAHSYCSDLPVSSAITDFPNIPADQTSVACNSYDQTVYFKGATFIEGVRSRMGDKAFFGSLRDLIADHRFGLITTAIVAENWIEHTASASRSKLEKYMRTFIDW